MFSSKSIYLDYQASCPTDDRVIHVIHEAMIKHFGNPHSVHSIGNHAANIIHQADEYISDLFQTDVGQYIYTSGATEANNLLLKGLFLDNKTERNKLLISEIEHKCVLETARYLKTRGVIVEYIKVDDKGLINIQDLEDKLDETVLLTSIMHINNEIGTVQDIENISKIIHNHGSLFHTDASQSAGNVQSLSIANYVDFFTISAHKMYGPQGIGALFIPFEYRNLFTPIIHGGGQQDYLRSGTLPVPLIAGFGEAARIINAQTPEYKKNILSLRNSLANGLLSLSDDFYLNGTDINTNNRSITNINICFKNRNIPIFIDQTRDLIAVSNGSACTSGITEPSYVLSKIGLNDDDAYNSIRLSVGRFTTQDDINKTVEIFQKYLTLKLK